MNGDMKRYSETSRRLFLEQFNWDSWGMMVTRVINERVKKYGI